MRRPVKKKPRAKTATHGEDAWNLWEEHRDNCTPCSLGQFNHPPKFCPRGQLLYNQMVYWKSREKWTASIARKQEAKNRT